MKVITVKCARFHRRRKSRMTVAAVSQSGLLNPEGGAGERERENAHKVNYNTEDRGRLGNPLWSRKGGVMPGNVGGGLSA